jgi:hypothetical protein
MRKLDPCRLTASSVASRLAHHGQPHFPRYDGGILAMAPDENGSSPISFRWRGLASSEKIGIPDPSTRVTK